MNKQIEALKLALEALEYVLKPAKEFDDDVCQQLHDNAITATREALAEQPCKYPNCPYPCQDLPDCRDAEQPAQDQGQSCYCQNCEALSKQVTALKTCLETERGFREQEQPAQQQEPLSRVDVACDIKTLCVNGDLPDSFEEVAEWVAAGSMPEQQNLVAWVEQPAQQQEPWGYLDECDKPIKLEDAKHRRQKENEIQYGGLQYLYTSPPASKPLTRDELRHMYQNSTAWQFYCDVDERLFGRPAHAKGDA